MPLLVNLRHLMDRDLALQGEVSASELDLETRDELIRVTSPLKYRIDVQKLEESLLARGQLRLELDCQCVRCLKPFKYPLELPDWICDVPLEGEEKAPIVNDCVDLTPYLREDILLTFPQHPLCEPECGGLKPQPAKDSPGEPETGPSPWSELDKLKL